MFQIVHSAVVFQVAIAEEVVYFGELHRCSVGLMIRSKWEVESHRIKFLDDQVDQVKRHGWLYE